MEATSETGSIPAREDILHEAGGLPGWRERITVTFGDAAAGIGVVARMNLYPVEKTADATINVFLPGDALATSIAKGAYERATTVGRLTFETPQPAKEWRVTCRDTALVFPNAGSAGLPRAGERQSAAARLEIDLTLTAWTEPYGRVDRERTVDDLNFVHVVSNGWFEQAVRVAGSIRVGNRQATIDAGGVRQRAWGAPRAESAAARGWIVAGFDPGTSLGLRGDTYGGRGGFAGWRAARGVLEPVEGLTVDVDIEGKNVRTARAEFPGEVFHAEVIAGVPIRDGGVRVQQALVACRLGTREAWGVAEFAAPSAGA